jgi:predicted RNA binding protein YcfA (HicA-like mRNA interferase family)
MFFAVWKSLLWCPPLIRVAVTHFGRKYDSFRRVKVRELITLIEADSWLQVRPPSKPGTVTVSGKPSIDVPTGTLNSALKQAGLK